MGTKALTPAKQGKASTPSFTPAATGLLQRACACGGHAGVDGACTECKSKRLTGEQRPLVQAKLNVSRPGDRYEQEADRIADQVMRIPAPQVQRQAMPEEEEEDETLQMKPLSDKITPLVQRQTIPEEEDEDKNPLSLGKVSLFPRRPEDTDQADTAEEVPVHLGSIGLTGLPSGPTEARGYSGPTAVESGRMPPPRLDPESLDSTRESSSTRWRIEQSAQVAEAKRPPSLGIEDVLEEAGNAIKKSPFKHLVGTVKILLKDLLLKEMLLKPAMEGDGNKLNKYQYKLEQQRQEQEKLINIRDKQQVREDKMKKEWEKKKGKVLMRQPLKEEEEDEEAMLQTKATAAQAPALTPAIETGIQSFHQSGSQPLDPATRAFMEPRFGHDFGQVRVHTGLRAAAAARTVSARARSEV